MSIYVCLVHDTHVSCVKKVFIEPRKSLTVELPESESELLESYCLERQESKQQFMCFLIRSLNNFNYLNVKLGDIFKFLIVV
jgi:hypothetical protein